MNTTPSIRPLHDNSAQSDSLPSDSLQPDSLRHDVLDSLDIETPNWLAAAQAADSKKAIDLRILDLREITSFTDYFVICTASSARTGQAIADAIGNELRTMGELPVSLEGYERGEWILLDYGDFIVHIFSETARSYYDLERLWRNGKRVELPLKRA